MQVFPCQAQGAKARLRLRGEGVVRVGAGAQQGRLPTLSGPQGHCPL